MKNEDDSENYENLNEIDDHDSDCKLEYLKPMNEKSVSTKMQEAFTLDTNDSFNTVKTAESTKKVYVNKSVQVTSGDFTTPFCTYIRNEKNLPASRAHSHCAFERA